MHSYQLMIIHYINHDKEVCKTENNERDSNGKEIIIFKIHNYQCVCPSKVMHFQTNFEIYQ